MIHKNLSTNPATLSASLKIVLLKILHVTRILFIVSASLKANTLKHSYYLSRIKNPQLYLLNIYKFRWVVYRCYSSVSGTIRRRHRHHHHHQSSSIITTTDTCCLPILSKAILNVFSTEKSATRH